MLAMQGDIPLKTLKVIESYWRSPGLAGILADKGEVKKKSTLISLHINYDLLFLKLSTKGRRGFTSISVIRNIRVRANSTDYKGLGFYTKHRGS